MATDQWQPRIVHDGIEELGHLPLGSSIELTCPRCEDVFEIDPIEVALAARSIGWCSSAEDRTIAAHVADTFGWTSRTVDDQLHLTGHRGLSPGITDHTCPSCGRALWIVTSTGELQPARNATAVEGVLVPPPPTRSDLGIGFLALVVAVGFVFALHLAAANIWFDHRALATNGVETAAVVTARSSSELPGQADQFWLSYQVSTGAASEGVPTGQIVTRAVDEATWLRSAVGESVTILVDPDDPTRSDVAGNDRPMTIVMIVGLIDVALLLAGRQIVRSARKPDQRDS